MTMANGLRQEIGSGTLAERERILGDSQRLERFFRRSPPPHTHTPALRTGRKKSERLNRTGNMIC